MEADIQAALILFHYSPQWLEYGFLDEELLRQQVAVYETSDDHNTEHYRYSMFRRVLKTRDSLDETEITRFIELAQADEDAGMGMSALIDLLSWDRLTEEQFESLCRHPAYDDPRPQKLIQRQRLYTALEAATLSPELFAQCLALPHNGIQRQLLLHPDLSDVQLEQIAEQGVNKAVRNIATVTLRARRSRRTKQENKP